MAVTKISKKTKAPTADPLLIEDNSNPFNSMMQRLDQAAKIMNLEDDVYQVVKVPSRIIEVSLPIKMDNGRVKVFGGYRVIHSTALGPSKGGIRFHPQVDEHEVRPVQPEPAVAQLHGTGQPALRREPFLRGDGAAHAARVRRHVPRDCHRYVGAGPVAGGDCRRGSLGHEDRHPVPGLRPGAVRW